MASNVTLEQVKKTSETGANSCRSKIGGTVKKTQKFSLFGWVEMGRFVCSLFLFSVIQSRKYLLI